MIIRKAAELMWEGGFKTKRSKKEGEVKKEEGEKEEELLEGGSSDGDHDEGTKDIEA